MTFRICALQRLFPESDEVRIDPERKGIFHLGFKDREGPKGWGLPHHH